YTISGLKMPLALSPGRQWVGATTANGRFRCYSSADGNPVGEIATPAAPTRAGFSPDGSNLALSFGSQFALGDGATVKPTGTWPVTPGAPEVVVDRPSTTINWFGGDYLMFGDRLLDRERELTLCEYKPANLWVAWSAARTAGSGPPGTSRSCWAASKTSA